MSYEFLVRLYVCVLKKFYISKDSYLYGPNIESTLIESMFESMFRNQYLENQCLGTAINQWNSLPSESLGAP